MLSRAAKLSKTYTNHCIGAVSIATLNSIVGVGSEVAAAVYVSAAEANRGGQSQIQLVIPYLRQVTAVQLERYPQIRSFWFNQSEAKRVSNTNTNVFQLQ